jgi:hypothetical protein
MIGAALEVMGMWVQAGRAEQLTQLRALLAYTLLAPSIGARNADEYLATHTGSSSRPAPAAPSRP